jgi:RNA polymerase sigma-70 factor (ECF subfamily)
MNLTDQLEDARMGNAAAQKVLFNRLADPMMALCCRYVKSREDAEEILLDGFCKFFAHLPLAGLSAAEIFDLIVRLPAGYRTGQ